MALQLQLPLTTEQKFYLMIALVGSFFFVEIITGYITNSLALISDAFHMLSDLLALIVGLAAVRISKKTSERNSFGWVRAEVMGALANAVFMLAVCLTIVLESIERFLHIQQIQKPVLLLVTGLGGLAINVIAFFLFISREKPPKPSTDLTTKHRKRVPSLMPRTNTADGEIAEPLQSTTAKNKAPEQENSSGYSMNIAAVLRHVIGDAMGSIIVVIVATLIWQIKAHWVLYLDPILSLCLVGAMSSSTFPLLSQASQVLMQQSPTEYASTEFRDRLGSILKELGVLSYHDLHIWRLSGSKLIASIHIVINHSSDTMLILETIRHFFHEENVHSVTIQPEIIQSNCENCTGDIKVVDGITTCKLSCDLDDDNADSSKLVVQVPAFVRKMIYAESYRCLFSANLAGNNFTTSFSGYCHDCSNRIDEKNA